jgi:hypothetical protein
MNCKLTMTLISESQKGECGDDWKYDLQAEVFEGELVGKGQISVPKHTLESGTVCEPFGSPEPVVLFEGECSSDLEVNVQLTATEVDLFVNDVGKASKKILIEPPHPGSTKQTREVDIDVNVKEAPAFLNKEAVFTLRVRFSRVSG